MKELLLIIVSSALVNNVVLSQFMGLCPFLGVFQDYRYGSWYGRCGYFCNHLVLLCNKCDLQADPSAA